MSKYVLGVDGGGTKTDFFVFTTSGEFVAKATGPATNHESYIGGFDEMTPIFEEILNRVLQQANIRAEELIASVFGMAGIDVPSQKERMEEYLISLGISNHRVYNDSFLGVKVACSKGYGISFVNGTGNSVGGIDKYGNWLQVGGTGEAFGDLGGASGMTSAVICAVYSQYYRCGRPTDMSRRMFNLLGITSPSNFTEAIYDQVYTGKITHRDIHNEVLYAAASEGDFVAVELLKSFGDQFAHSIGGCINNLRFDEDEVELVLIGSATLRALSPIMMDHCARRIYDLTRKKVKMIPLSVPPAAGAVLWAIELAKGPAAANAVHDKVIDALI
ncbi:MAG TPA: hypothetical protein GX701_05750 [Clostridiales bacterium]|jgi:N-acetylglucosamine kinase-like BadF-type ATPase|nr:hypothetical protein [Clostridiales bacterium]